MHFSAGQDVWLKKLQRSNIFPSTVFNPIQARGHYVSTSPKSQHIFQTAWSLELLICDFSSMYFPLRKVQFYQSALMHVAMATMQLFGLFFKTEIAIVFQVIPPEKNFLWNNLLCFWHHNTLRSLIIANIRTVTMETFQKIILPKYGHRH